jgi:hypothetical protein
MLKFLSQDLGQLLVFIVQGERLSDIGLLRRGVLAVSLG